MSDSPKLTDDTAEEITAAQVKEALRPADDLQVQMPTIHGLGSISTASELLPVQRSAEFDALNTVSELQQVASSQSLDPIGTMTELPPVGTEVSLDAIKPQPQGSETVVKLDAVKTRQKLSPAKGPFAVAPVAHPGPSRILLGAVSLVALAVVVAVGYLAVKGEQQPQSRRREAQNPVLNKTSEPEGGTKNPTENKAEIPIPALAKLRSKFLIQFNARDSWIEPWSEHAADVELNPRRKYSLQLRSQPEGAGEVFARLQTGTDQWGPMNRLVGYRAFKISKASLLRVHCEPGPAFSETAAFDLDLHEEGSKTIIPIRSLPSQHCLNYEKVLRRELVEGTRYTLTLLESSTAKVGDKMSLQLAYRFRSMRAPIVWKSGVLDVAETVEVEGAFVQFAVFDALVTDNSGTVDVELAPKEK
jgi:hypothetical protein